MPLRLKLGTTIALALVLLVGCRQKAAAPHKQPLGPWRLGLLEATSRQLPFFSPPQGLNWLCLMVEFTPPENGSLAASEIAVVDGANGKHPLHAIGSASEDPAFLIVAEGRNPFDSFLPPGWGWAADKNNKPIPNLRVMVDGKGETILWLSFDYTRGTSVFDFTRRTPVPLALLFFVPLRTKGLRLQFGEKDVVDLPRYVVRGRVIDETGRSVEGIPLRLDGELVTSDAYGHFFVLRKDAVKCKLEVLLQPKMYVESAPDSIAAAPGDEAKEATVVVSWLRR
jgi:hypothetical protein